MSIGRTVSRDIRRPAEVGRSARLELVFGARGGKTVLVSSYAEPPLRVGRCFDEGRGLRLIVASSAPGIFGGDVIRQRVENLAHGCPAAGLSSSQFDGASASVTSEAKNCACPFSREFRSEASMVRSSAFCVAR